MELKFERKVNLQFSVQYFEGMEGGMAHEYFANPVDTLEEAVEQLLMAKTMKPNDDWVIVGETVDGEDL